MGRLDGDREAPHCPICEGPCEHEFERSEWRFPDKLPKAKDSTPEPVKAKKENRRGRRMRRPEHHEPRGPVEDRMVRPEEDR